MKNSEAEKLIAQVKAMFSELSYNDEDTRFFELPEFNEPTGNDEMSNHISGRELDAELRALEAQTDTKFVQLNGTLEVMNVKLDGVAAGRQATIIATWSLAALILASVAMVIAFGAADRNNIIAAFSAGHDQASSK